MTVIRCTDTLFPCAGKVGLVQEQRLIYKPMPRGQRLDYTPTKQVQTISALKPARNSPLHRGSKSLYSPVLTVHLPL